MATRAQIVRLASRIDDVVGRLSGPTPMVIVGSDETLEEAIRKAGLPPGASIIAIHTGVPCPQAEWGNWG